MKRWRTRALERREWASVIREAKAKLSAVMLKKKKEKKITFMSSNYICFTISRKDSQYKISS